MSPRNIDYILCAITYPENFAFPLASTVQANLGAENATVLDIKAACSGFLRGLELAANLIETGAYRNILLIGAETPSRLYDEVTGREIAMLFGDGAGAKVITRTENPQPWVFVNHDDGTKAGLISRPVDGDKTPIFRGLEVFQAAVTQMVSNSNLVLAKAGLSMKDIDFVFPHMANDRIIKAVAARLGLAYLIGGKFLRLNPKVISNIRDWGNTSAASVPILMAEAFEKKKFVPGSGRLALITVFGAGITSGAGIIQL
jgi:3-oxoacyl-[acyl-carrier-protein] synthase-3